VQQQDETGSPVRVQIITPSFTTQQHESTTVPVFVQTIREPVEARAEAATTSARARVPRIFFMNVPPSVLSSNVGPEERAGQFLIGRRNSCDRNDEI